MDPRDGEPDPAESAELVVDARCVLGEGPLWDARAGRLVWVDIERPSIHWLRPADGASGRRPLRHMPGALGLRAAGGYVVADELGFGILDDAELERESDEPLPRRTVADVIAGDPRVRMNDGAVDPAGRFWAGTMEREGQEPAGALFRLEADGATDVLVDGITIPNGIDWSPDGRTMYMADTPTGRIDAWHYDRESGAITGRRTFATIPGDDGTPDGMTVDADGRLWVAIYGRGEVRVFAPDGLLERRLSLPATQVTKPAFGGPDLEDLYVTTAARHLDEAGLGEQPGAGGLFRFRPGVRGKPPHHFRG